MARCGGSTILLNYRKLALPNKSDKTQFYKTFNGRNLRMFVMS
jgi:hypothetical protein